MDTTNSTSNNTMEKPSPSSHGSENFAQSKGPQILVNNQTLVSQSPQGFGDAGSNLPSETIVQSVVSAPHSWIDRLMTSADSGLYSTTEDYLKRPIIVETGVFSSTDIATTFTGGAVFDKVLKSYMALAHLKGKFLARADVRFRLEVNANKFQAGRYILAYVPFGGAPTTTAGAWYYMHRHSKTQITQLHHAEIDINTQSEVELVIPYNSMFQGVFVPGYINGIVNPLGEIGWYFLYPYSAVASAAGSTATYTLWANLENVTLTGLATPQMGKNKSNAIMEAESVGAGPISSVARKIATTGRVLSKIPLLSNFTSPAAWTADIVADAAKIWGWSKPQNHSQTQPVLPRVLSNHANCDTLDNSMSLALTSVNEVSSMPCGLTQEDEMSFDHIWSKYAYINYFYWSTSQTADTSLFQTAVHPKFCKVQLSEGTRTYISQAPVAFVSQFFYYWRGGLTFRLKMVKTAFHSGRLLIMFSPNPKTYTAFTSTNNNATSMWTHRVIVDIRDKTEIEFSVPYMSILPWMTNLDDYGTGIVKISILDPLVAASTVSSSVYASIEVKASDDFEVAVPSQPIGTKQLCPMTPYTLQMGSDPSSGEKAVVTLGDITSDKLANTEFCIGEKILSFRQLAKRYSFFYREMWDGNILIRPFRFEVSVNRNVTTWYAPNHSDMIDVISSCYLYSRGSMRIRFIETQPSEGMCTTSLTMDDVTNGPLVGKVAYNPVSSTLYHTDEAAVLFHDSKRGIEVTVPMYHISHTRNLVSEMTNATAVADGATGFQQQSSLSSQQILGIYHSSTTGFQAGYRAAGEDFSLHCFICTPLLTALV